MRHQSLSQLRDKAEVNAVPTPAVYRQRQLRWAAVLAAHGEQPLRALMAVELYAKPVRRTLRRDDSPIALAYADPELRAAGLAGDTLGHAQDFFGLGDREAHEALCDCHAPGRLTGREASRRISAIAEPSLWRRIARVISARG